MGSFRLKLLSYFVLIAIVPTGVAFYGLDTFSKRRETQRIDSRLRTDVRFALAGYAQQLDASERRALQLPLSIALQRLRGDIDSRDGLVAVRSGQIVAGRSAGSALQLLSGVPAQFVLGGTAYRGLVSNPLSDPEGVQFAVFAPQHELASAIASARWRIGLGLLGVILGLTGLTYLLGLSVVRSLNRLIRGADTIARGKLDERVEVRGHDEFARVADAFNRMAMQLEQRLAELEQERRRAREGTARFAEVLAATHDVEQLLRVVVETAVEVTGAAGGVVIGPEGELARTGEVESGAELLELPLKAGRRSFGTVVLSGEAFDEDRREAAVSLVSHAVVALENAHLHRVVERQARIDELTGLANRRSVEEALRTELARAERFNNELCLIFADLDNFKDVNDQHGHPFGDVVLCTFADTLSQTLRDIDLAGRWGGEEFAFILPGTNAEGGAAVAERARQAIAQCEILTPDGQRVALSASFGVASYPTSADLETLIAAADEALYRAKRSGKDRVGTPLGLVGSLDCPQG